MPLASSGRGTKTQASHLVSTDITLPRKGGNMLAVTEKGGWWWSNRRYIENPSSLLCLCWHNREGVDISFYFLGIYLLRVGQILVTNIFSPATPAILPSLFLERAFLGAFKIVSHWPFWISGLPSVKSRLYGRQIETIMSSSRDPWPFCLLSVFQSYVCFFALCLGFLFKLGRLGRDESISSYTELPHSSFEAFYLI